MVNAQEWLDENYPKWKRKGITHLNIINKNLQGSLKLEGFVNLKWLYCGDNQLANLDLSNCDNLEYLYCYSNQFPNLNFLDTLKNLERLTVFSISKNNSTGDLSPLQKSVNLEELYLSNNHFIGSLHPLQGMVKLYWLDISDTDIENSLEYLPENLKRIRCTDWCAEQLKNYSGIGGYNYQAWRKDNLYPYLINKAESLQSQLTGNQTIINNLQGELTAWQTPLFWPQPTLGQPDSAITFRTQINSFDVLGTAGLCLLARHLYRKYKNSRQGGALLDEERQPLLRSPEEIARLNQIENVSREEQAQLTEIARIILPNEKPRFATLKQEITRLKYQELVSQVRKEKAEVERLITEAKEKVGESFVPIVDSLLRTKKQSRQTNETSLRNRLNIKLETYQEILEENNLSNEEIQALLSKQTELYQLEEHLASLQQNQEQTAHIQQSSSTYPF